MTTHGMGRRFAPDDRDRRFLMARPMGEASTVIQRCWHSHGVMNQGDTPQCVGYSIWNWLASGPVVNIPKFTPEWLYQEAQKEDEWPGEDYPGTSGRAGFKVLLREGYIGEYRWAFDAPTIFDHILANGPVVVGTNWYEAMSKPDANGFVRPGGAIAGGHEYLLIGANREHWLLGGNIKIPAVRIVNSWGTEWGQHGRAWLALSDLDRLMKEDGEASIATEVKHALFAEALPTYA